MNWEYCVSKTMYYVGKKRFKQAKEPARYIAGIDTCCQTKKATRNVGSAQSDSRP
jgi:hypothetical protein